MGPKVADTRACSLSHHPVLPPQHPPSLRVIKTVGRVKWERRGDALPLPEALLLSPFETPETETDRLASGPEERGQLLWWGSSYRRRKESWAENNGRTRYQRLTCLEQQRRGMMSPPEQPGTPPGGRGLRWGDQPRCGLRKLPTGPPGQRLWLSQKQNWTSKRNLYLKDMLRVFSRVRGIRVSAQLCLTLGVLITGGGGWERHST